MKIENLKNYIKENNKENGDDKVMNKIKVIDCPMGFGKTSYLIQMINNNSDTKYMFITPFLDEVERIETSCTNRKFYQPTNKNKDGSKLTSLKQLVAKGKNIVSTHALFSMADEELIKLIKSQGYVLILDEVMDVVEQVNITKDDIDTLISKEYIKIEDQPYNKIIWVNENYNGRYNDIKIMAYNESLYFVNNTIIVWTLPVNVFKCFEDIYISTYLFDAQIQKYYYDYFEMEYEYYNVIKTNDIYTIVPTINKDYENNFKAKAKELINIIDNPKLNAIGDYYGNNIQSALSKAWYLKNKNTELMKTLQKNLLNYFRRYCDDKSDLNMWTTFKDYKGILKGKGYTKGFIPSNCRATNQYSHKTGCAYTINKYLNPFYLHFFNQRNIEVNQDKYALSELLQWIWRSRIRNNEPINLYIPSQRMRELLIDFLNNK